MNALIQVEPFCEYLWVFY